LYLVILLSKQYFLPIPIQLMPRKKKRTSTSKRTTNYLADTTNGALKFKLNETKSVNTTYFLRQWFCPNVTFNGYKFTILLQPNIYSLLLTRDTLEVPTYTTINGYHLTHKNTYLKIRCSSFQTLVLSVIAEI